MTTGHTRGLHTAQEIVDSTLRMSGWTEDEIARRAPGITEEVVENYLAERFGTGE